MEKGLIAIGIGISMISGLGVGLGQGLALLVRQLKQLEEILKQTSKIRTMMLVGQAVSESACYLCISYINSINVCF